MCSCWSSGMPSSSGCCRGRCLWGLQGDRPHCGGGSCCVPGCGGPALHALLLTKPQPAAERIPTATHHHHPTSTHAHTLYLRYTAQARGGAPDAHAARLGHPGLPHARAGAGVCAQRAAARESPRRRTLVLRQPWCPAQAPYRPEVACGEPLPGPGLEFLTCGCRRDALQAEAPDAAARAPHHP